jgi:hypothetical protein
MNRDQAKQLASDALEQLAKALESGRSEALREYLAAMSKFHNYSFGNIMLIAFQRENATHVAGFHTWHKMGRFVKKGEKGIMILAPIVYKRRIEEQAETDESEVSALAGFRPAYVFDISQTDGEPLPEFASVKGDPADYMERLKKLVEENGISLDYSTDILPARGISAGGKITLAPDLTAAETFSTLVHEFAHEALHKGERRAETTRQIRETEAEAVAFVVANAIGLDTNTASSDYIQLYRGDKAVLAESLEFIQQVASQILAVILPEGKTGE